MIVKLTNYRKIVNYKKFEFIILKYYFCKKNMKYLFYFIVLLFVYFALIPLNSCTKDCKYCKSVTTDSLGNVIQEGQLNEYCDEALEEKENQEPVTVGDLTTKWVCE